jgi:regulator of sigma E protease
MTTLLAAVIVLGPVIVFHEFGHFIVAKLAGIYVKTFSVGFGPKLLRWRMGETEYCLSALPFGGYVRMAGDAVEELGAEPSDEAPSEAVDTPAPEGTQADKRVGEKALYPTDGIPDADIPPHRYLRNKPIATRLAVVTAGPVANLVLAVIVLTFGLHHDGMPVLPTTTLDTIAGDSPEAAAGLHTGDVIEAIDGTRVTNSLEVVRRIAALDDKPFSMMVRRAGTDTTVQMPAVRHDGGEIAFPALRFRPDSRIGTVKKSGPADRAGLRAGDRIVEIDGQNVQFYDQLADRINPSIGDSLHLVWERDGVRMSGTVVPEPAEVPVPGSPTELQTVGRIQIEPFSLVIPIGWGRAFEESVAISWNLTRETLRFLGQLVRGKGSRDAIGGPIRIAQVAGSELRWGLSRLFMFMAFFSVNLFLLNMLPIPVLDGGHVAFLLIEAVRGEALSVRVQETALKVGVSALIALMGYVVVMDLWRVFTGP